MHNTKILKLTILSALLSSAAFANAATLTVGPGKTYPNPCAAFNAASDNDVIQIEASGNYTGNVCYITKNGLNIKGVNGRPKIDANGAYAAGKGTWVFGGTNNTVDNIEFSGARVPDQNGAGIRLDGQNLTVTNSYFHDNENGILTNNSGGNVVITGTEFAHNGHGDGYSHNLYIGHIDSLTFIGNYSHDANVGHNLKSRAAKNIVKYNRFSSSVAGTAGAGAPSYEVNFPNGGTTYLIGNVIQQPAQYNNPNIVAYGEEGATNPKQDFYVVNNTFINDASSSNLFLMIGSGVTTPVLIQNNLFAGNGQMTNQGTATVKTNYSNVAPAFVNKATYDLHPAPGSPMINAGSAVTPVDAAATLEYKHVAQTSARPVNGTIDIGAYESTTTVVTPPVTPPVNPVPSWTTCATENGTCSFTGTREVRFGANGKFTSKTATGSIACTTSVFGDPIYGVVKSCSYSSVVISAPIPAPVETWTTCAAENGTCSFSGTRNVRYGANNIYVTRTAVGSIGCNNNIFGDPTPNVVKSCSYSSITQSSK